MPGKADTMRRMTLDQVLVFAILATTVGLFLWGRWRHDMVAIASLLACVVAGLVPTDEAFAGFGHPAVITVACVLVLSRGCRPPARSMRWPTACTARQRRAAADHRRAHLPRRVAVGVHEQRRRHGAADAGGAQRRQSLRPAAGQGAHAAGLRHHPRRHDDADRHAAQSHRLRLPRGDHGHQLRHVRLHPRGPRGRVGRRRFRRSVRLASGAGAQTGRRPPASIPAPTSPRRASPRSARSTARPCARSTSCSRRPMPRWSG
jgi:hypothetical protein